MFVDTRDLADRQPLQADLCVIGAGAAGIALALELADSAMRILLLEGGGSAAELDGRGIYQVVAGATPSLCVDPSQQWYFGGNTNHWFGNCRPLDAADFEPREWIRYSGWPIRRSELLPYYERAQTVCGLGDFRRYDLVACRPHLEHPPLDVDAARLSHKIVHACPARHFADCHRQRLAAAQNLRVLLHARALRLRTNAHGDRVETVDIAGSDGWRSRVEAGVVVLATGGIENARLLLCSGEAQSTGVANEHDLVGRYFMEHWYVDLPLGRAGDAHDLHFYREPESVGAALIWGQLALTDALVRSERLPGLSLWFKSITPIAPAARPAGKILTFLRARARLGQPLTDVRLALSDPGNAAAHIARQFGRRAAAGRSPRGHVLRVQLEQTPDPENRIRFDGARDRHGAPAAKLRLRLSEDECRGHLRALRLLAAALGLNGPRVARQLQLKLDAGRYGFFSHHTGTTRMHDDPAQGVVDADCRAHGVGNLYVAGSSVFPTAGTAAPTLTIVALALRLADHLRGTVSAPSVV